MLAVSACGGKSETSLSGSGVSVSTGESSSQTSLENTASAVKVATADRTIAVEAVTGSVKAVSETENFAPIAGDHLKSGQEVRTQEESDLTLLLDADKHVYAAERTKFLLEAAGSAKSTKTRLMLMDGTLVCGIDNKLGDEETFSVETVNATMAVRGTVFTVSVITDPNGMISTTLHVTEGTVETVTLEYGEEKVLTVSDGEEVSFTGANPKPDEWNDMTGIGVDLEMLEPAPMSDFERYKSTTSIHTWLDGDMAEHQSELVVVDGSIWLSEDYLKDHPEPGKLHQFLYAFVADEPITMEDGSVQQAFVAGNNSWLKEYDTADIPLKAGIEAYGYFFIYEMDGVWNWHFSIMDYRVK